MIAPPLKEIDGAMRGQVKVVKLDFNPGTAAKYDADPDGGCCSRTASLPGVRSVAPRSRSWSSGSPRWYNGLRKISALRPRTQHMTDTRAAFGKALSWRCTRVFVTDSESSNCGAILHGFAGRSGKPLAVYTEATGYAISLFHFLARTRGEAPLVGMAQEAVDARRRVQRGRVG